MRPEEPLCRGFVVVACVLHCPKAQSVALFHNEVPVAHENTHRVVVRSSPSGALVDSAHILHSFELSLINQILLSRIPTPDGVVADLVYLE